MDPNKIRPEQFTYNLPKERIAKFPLEDRAASKLLYFDHGSINHRTFRDITSLLPEDSCLFFNDTKVIPARLIFFKNTGARIEIFLLEPSASGINIEEAMLFRGKASWKAMIGNAKKWKKDQPLQLPLTQNIELKAIQENQEVHFEWNSEHTFSEILEMAGKVPLPPYIDREPADLDVPRYQTVYSRHEGAVAAPTAGLHFTQEVMDEIKHKHVIDYVTLHVSAGTFQPIKSSVADHPMHREQVVITRKNLETLLTYENIIVVGTTSMRTLESLYWYGVKVLEGTEEFFVEKLDPYRERKLPDRNAALEAVRNLMIQKNMDTLLGYTEIFIFPGYDFKICKGLVTNFHLPGTTLMMLIAAFIGDAWENVYKEALENGYRFLSYGDSSLLLP